MIWVWVGVVVISAIIEAISWDLTSIWITFGGITALILCAIAPETILWQIILFVVITALCIIFLRPIEKKCISKKTIATNISSFIGQKSKLITPITENELGTIKLNGVLWNVKSENNEPINENEKVEIIEISGNTLTVKKIENKIEGEN